MEKYYKKVGRKYVEIPTQQTRFMGIDFFEFSFLVEACAGRRPIARAMFFKRVIDEYYHVLSQNERDRLYEWLNRNSSFQYDLEKGEESCLLFNARFDKNNQFLVTTNYDSKESVHECFFYKEDYYLTENKLVNKEFIIKVKRKEYGTI